MEVTEEEAQLYDRQIRLWGMEAQNRLKKSKVFVIGVNGLTAELIKNLTLAGIDTLDVCDTSDVEKKDVKHNFLLMEESIGLNKAQAVVTEANKLNPRVNMRGYCNLPMEFTINHSNCSIKDYNIIIVADSLNNWIDIDRVCCEMKKPIIALDSFGWFGIAFFNLGIYNYFIKNKPTNSSKDEIQDLSEDVDEIIEKQRQFCSFKSTSELDWSDSHLKAKLRRTPKHLFLLIFLQYYVNKIQRYITIEDIPEMQSQWLNFSNEYFHTPVDVVNLNSLKMCTGQGISPVNAVLGGLVSQEIIKILSKSWEPTGNFLLFDGNTCNGDSLFIESYQ